MAVVAALTTEEEDHRQEALQQASVHMQVKGPRDLDVSNEWLGCPVQLLAKEEQKRNNIHRPIKGILQLIKVLTSNKLDKNRKFSQHI